MGVPPMIWLEDPQAAFEPVNFSRDFFLIPRYLVSMHDEQLFPGVDRPTSQDRPAAPAQRPRLRRVDRQQVVIMPRCLDELLAADHQARVIWAVIQRLDLSGFLASIAARGEAP